MLVRRKAKGKLVATLGTRSRRLVLVDLENFLGEPQVTESEAAQAAKIVRATLSLSELDLVVVGTSHTNNLLAAGVGWQSARQVLELGHNGADIALLNEMTTDIKDRFTGVVVVSGDGIFAPRIAELAAEGLATTILTGRGTLSHHLLYAANSVIHADLRLAA